MKTDLVCDKLHKICLMQKHGKWFELFKIKLISINRHDVYAVMCNLICIFQFDRYTPENEENMSHYGNLSPSSPCSPYLKCYGEDGVHIEHSGSSDDEVKFDTQQISINIEDLLFFVENMFKNFYFKGCLG